ncbi:MAG: hypothetical protein WKF81_03100 [Thermomicrobiales bacterium]
MGQDFRRVMRSGVLPFIVAMCCGLVLGTPGISLAVAPALNQTGEVLPPAGPVIVVLNGADGCGSGHDRG